MSNGEAEAVMDGPADPPATTNEDLGESDVPLDLSGYPTTATRKASTHTSESCDTSFEGSETSDGPSTSTPSTSPIRSNLFSPSSPPVVEPYRPAGVKTPVVVEVFIPQPLEDDADADADGTEQQEADIALDLPNLDTSFQLHGSGRASAAESKSSFVEKCNSLGSSFEIVDASEADGYHEGESGGGRARTLPQGFGMRPRSGSSGRPMAPVASPASRPRSGSVSQLQASATSSPRMERRGSRSSMFGAVVRAKQVAASKVRTMLATCTLKCYAVSRTIQPPCVYRGSEPVNSYACHVINCTR
jgi:hypothetical protein